MILGFISFTLALLVEFGATIPYDLLMAFEWAHFLIFAAAMMYVGNALVASGAMEATMRSWRGAQTMTVDEAVDDMWDQAESVSCLQLKSKLPLLSRGWRQDIDYKLVRHIFLAEYGLPRSFDYLSYVKRILHRNVGHSIHIHVDTWMYIIGIVVTIVGGIWGFRFSVDNRADMEAFLENTTVADVQDLRVAGGLLANAVNSSMSAASGVNTTDVGGRRQLGGGGEASAYAQDTPQTTRWTIVICAVFGWVLVGVQVALTLSVEVAWQKIFTSKGVPNEADMEALEASMKGEILLIIWTFPTVVY